jgi:hypothetical protein
MIKALETANAHYGALVTIDPDLASAQTTNHVLRRRVMWSVAGAMATAAATAAFLVVPHNFSLLERLAEKVAKFYPFEPVTSIEGNKAERARRRRELSQRQGTNTNNAVEVDDIPRGVPTEDMQRAPEGSSEPGITITLPPTILVEAASQAAFPIRVTPVNAVPRNSFVRVRGLPSTAALSEGYSITPSAWAVSLAALPELKIVLPPGTTGRSEIVVTLVSIDRSVLAESKSILAVSSADPRSVTARGAEPPGAPSIVRLGIGDGAKPSGHPRQTVTQPTTPQDRERAVRLVTKGDEQLAVGNIATARLFYERAADAGLAEAAMALAGTFDAEELARLGVHSVQPDPKLARHWYQRAQQLGASNAEEHQRRIGTPTK